jgi:hypothetical protein
MDLGKIVEIPLRELWPGEATHFTPWLAQNLTRLSEALGLDLELEAVEASAGDFSADIVAKDLGTNRRVIIENQFGGTDHRHLGQILTYSSMLNASAVIWIAERVRPEHKSAIDFLNLNLKETLQIFALEANVIRIDDSKPAFDLKLVCMPAETVSSTAGVATEASETQERYRAFFQELIDELRTVHKFTNARAGQPQNWYTFASENSKFYKFSAAFSQGGRVRVETYIDCGDKLRNEAIFDHVYSRRSEVEAAFGSELAWERLDNRRACRIAIYRDGEIDADSEALADTRRWVVLNLLRMRQVLSAFLDKAVVSTVSLATERMRADQP